MSAGQGFNGFVSALTKNTASVRMNFPAGASDQEVLGAVLRALFAELREAGRGGEAEASQWGLKDGKIERSYSVAGVGTARVRLVRVAAERKVGETDGE